MPHRLWPCMILLHLAAAATPSCFCSQFCRVAGVQGTWSFTSPIVSHYTFSSCSSSGLAQANITVNGQPPSEIPGANVQFCPVGRIGTKVRVPLAVNQDVLIEVSGVALGHDADPAVQLDIVCPGVSPRTDAPSLTPSHAPTIHAPTPQASAATTFAPSRAVCGRSGSPQLSCTEEECSWQINHMGDTYSTCFIPPTENSTCTLYASNISCFASGQVCSCRTFPSGTGDALRIGFHTLPQCRILGGGRLACPSQPGCMASTTAALHEATPVYIGSCQTLPDVYMNLTLSAVCQRNGTRPNSDNRAIDSDGGKSDLLAGLVAVVIILMILLAWILCSWQRFNWRTSMKTMRRGKVVTLNEGWDVDHVATPSTSLPQIHEDDYVTTTTETQNPDVDDDNLLILPQLWCTCGARLTPGVQFCAQCGTSV